MAQLDTMKALLGSPDVSDSVLQFYLDNASDIIKELRNADYIESKYLNAQIKIAIELFSKSGIEGQTSHSENGINRQYESADVSPSLLAQVSPFVRTPFSTVRVVPTP